MDAGFEALAQGCARCLSVRDRYRDRDPRFRDRGDRQSDRDETETKTFDSETNTGTLFLR